MSRTKKNTNKSKTKTSKKSKTRTKSKTYSPTQVLILRPKTRKYTEEDIKSAMNLVKQGWSWHKAALAKNIPKSTLADYINQKSKIGVKQGVKPKLDIKFETILATKLKNDVYLENNTRSENFLRVFKSFFNELNIENPFKNNKNESPCMAWITRFYGRNYKILKGSRYCNKKNTMKYNNEIDPLLVDTLETEQEVVDKEPNEEVSEPPAEPESPSIDLGQSQTEPRAICTRIAFPISPFKCDDIDIVEHVPIENILEPPAKPEGPSIDLGQSTTEPQALCTQITFPTSPFKCDHIDIVEHSIEDLEVRSMGLEDHAVAETVPIEHITIKQEFTEICNQTEVARPEKQREKKNIPKVVNKVISKRKSERQMQQDLKGALKLVKQGIPCRLAAADKNIPVTLLVNFLADFWRNSQRQDVTRKLDKSSQTSTRLLHPKTPLANIEVRSASTQCQNMVTKTDKSSQTSKRLQSETSLAKIEKRSSSTQTDVILVNPDIVTEDQVESMALINESIPQIQSMALANQSIPQILSMVLNNQSIPQIQSMALTNQSIPQIQSIDSANESTIEIESTTIANGINGYLESMTVTNESIPQIESIDSTIESTIEIESTNIDMNGDLESKIVLNESTGELETILVAKESMVEIETTVEANESTEQIEDMDITNESTLDITEVEIQSSEPCENEDQTSSDETGERSNDGQKSTSQNKRDVKGKKYTEEDIKSALNLIKQGWNCHRAAKAKNIPKSTLSDYLKNKSKFGKKPGVPPKVDIDIEKDLVARLQSMGELSARQVSAAFVRLLSHICTEKNIKNPFENKVPAKSYIARFCKRYPQIKLVHMKKLKDIQRPPIEDPSSLDPLQLELLEICSKVDLPQEKVQTEIPKQKIPRPKTRRYTEEDLRTALYLINKKGWSVFKTAKHTNIPKSTLSDYAHKKSKIGVKPGVGLKLDAEFEQALVHKIQTLAGCGKKKMTRTIKKLITEIYEKMGVNPFKNNKKGVPNHTWMVRFYKRHPELLDLINI